MGLEKFGGALNHAPGLLGRVIGPIAIQGQSLEILQDQKGGVPLPPAPSHGLALVLNSPDLILGLAAGHRPDNNPGQALAPRGMALNIGYGAIGGKVFGPEGCIPGGQDRRS